MSSTHKALASVAIGKLEIIERSLPALKDEDVLIKVEYASMIAFDTYVHDLAYFTELFPYPNVHGFNGSGIVADVGKDVKDLKKGDRVTAFTVPGNDAKSMQEYSVVTRAGVSKIPEALSLESAVTIPDNFITAFNTLFNTSNFALPIPPTFPAETAPALAEAPILVYGAGSTTGLYAIQLLKSAGYKNIIATASPRNHDYLRSLGAHFVFDYRSDTLTEDIARVSQSGKVPGKVDLALDCVTAEGTLTRISQVIDPSGTVALLLPVKKGDNVRARGEGEADMTFTLRKGLLPETVRVAGVTTFTYLENKYFRDNLMTRILPELLEQGIIEPNKIRLLDETNGSLKDRVEVGLDLLRNNKVSGEKVVVKIHPIGA